MLAVDQISKPESSPKSIEIKSSHPWQGHGAPWWIAVIGFPPLIFGVSWGLYELAITHTHYLVGALLAFFIAVGSAGLISSVYEKRLSEVISTDPDTQAQLRFMVFVSAFSFSIAAALLLVTIFAWISYALVASGLQETPAGSATPPYSSFVNMYGWHLVDLVPLMNAEKTLGVKGPPLAFQGWTAGMPVVVFRLLVGVVAFTAIRRAWTKLMAEPRPKSV